MAARRNRSSSGGTDPATCAFTILTELNCGNNQWRVVCDLTRGRMYFRSVKAQRIRYMDFDDFDFTSAQPALFLDIQLDLAGDVAGQCRPLTDKIDREFIRKALAPWKFGFWSDLFFKPLLAKRLFGYTKSFTGGP